MIEPQFVCTKSRERAIHFGEVFTPEKIVSAMLDLVEEETRRIDSRFLDPACGTGNFPVAILRRKLKVVGERYGENQEEYERYALLAVSSIYGIELLEDNVRECRARLLEEFNEAYTEFWGGKIRQTVIETASSILAENIIHGDTLAMRTEGEKPRPIIFFDWFFDKDGALRKQDFYFTELLGGGSNLRLFPVMQFDVIIGNPPYHKYAGGGRHGFAPVPLYHEFIRQAKELNPRFLVMIIPARWYSGGRGLNEFRHEMLRDNRIREIHDFCDSDSIFPDVKIVGGVCYFKWERDSPGPCKVYSYDKGRCSVMERPLLEPGADTFIRLNEAISIFHKIRSFNEPPITTIMSLTAPFGFQSTDLGKPEPFPGAVKLYRKGGIGWVSRDEITRNIELVDAHKVYITRIYNFRACFPTKMMGSAFYGEPNSCCSETYIVLGPFLTKQNALNALSYIHCRLFRFLVFLRKQQVNSSRPVYGYVPLQDFSKPWSDEELYAKYGLTEDEIALVEKLILPMGEPTKARKGRPESPYATLPLFQELG